MIPWFIATALAAIVFFVLWRFEGRQRLEREKHLHLAEARLALLLDETVPAAFVQAFLEGRILWAHRCNDRGAKWLLRFKSTDGMVSEPFSHLRRAVSYKVILADPPWRYEHVRTKSRRIENHYPTMTLEEICALPVESLAEKDSILFLWATAPKLAEAIQVMKAWGFLYRTCAMWDKEKMGMGYWFRIQHELLLVGMRGKPKTPVPAARFRSVFRQWPTKHSAKPAEFHERIEKMFPDARKVELFARETRAGWDVWGNEVASSVTL